VDELLTRTFIGGFVRLHVLYHAAREPVFGVEIMEELARHGYDVGPGTLYPMLHQLEEAG
jgi:DNA-binding PadR family transcriptional regulator